MTAQIPLQGLNRLCMHNIIKYPRNMSNAMISKHLSTIRKNSLGHAEKKFWMKTSLVISFEFLWLFTCRNQSRHPILMHWMPLWVTYFISFYLLPLWCRWVAEHRYFIVSHFKNWKIQGLFNCVFLLLLLCSI